MLRQDYILRMIRQLAQAIARLTAKARSEEPAIVHAELNEALKDLTGLDFDVLDSLPLAAVLQVLKADNEPNPARILAIAECSFVRAQLADATDQNDTALRARVMALTLYLETFTLFRHEALAEAENRAKELLTDLGEIDLPGDTILRLFRYRSAAGRFDEAENALFDLVERGLANSAVIDEGRAFYRRLLDLEDAQLLAGNLPRDEVRDGMAELEAASSGS
ncbi:MAG: DUF6483 family protein [Acidobacteriota bacterium]